MKQAGRSPLMFLLRAKALACHAVYRGVQSYCLTITSVTLRTGNGRYRSALLTAARSSERRTRRR